MYEIGTSFGTRLGAQVLDFRLVSAISPNETGLLRDILRSLRV